MSLKLKVNFLKGWPCPSIVDFVSTNTPSSVALDEGMIAHRDSAGKWVLGVANVKEHAYVLWNGAARDGDHGAAFPSTATASQSHYVQTNYGGVQGIALLNQIEVETAQYTGAPVFGDELSAGTDGILKVAVNPEIVIAVCTKGVHAKPGHGAVNMITFLPTAPRVKA